VQLASQLSLGVGTLNLGQDFQLLGLLTHVRTFESPSLVLVINDTKLLMSCVKCFELGISNTCDEGVCGME
jgi:hypothetical protein